MRLALAHHPITEIAFGGRTHLEGTSITVQVDELRRTLLADECLTDVDVEIVEPGERCRAGPVFDIIEPRAKAPGSSPDFPGILSPPLTAGMGTTHVLKGMAVTVLSAEASGGTSRGTIGSVLEMSGEAARASFYSTLRHLILVPRGAPGSSAPVLHRASRVAGLRASIYLARAAIGNEPAEVRAFAPLGPAERGREDLPRVAYVGQIFSRQRKPQVDEPVLYGGNTAGMVAVVLHPDEWLDGAVVTSYHTSMGGAETFFYQNHPIITELYRRHENGELNFVGTVATVAGADNQDRDRNCHASAHLVQWVFHADAAVLSKYGGGVPHADLAETARLLERAGVRTAVMVSDVSRDRRVESALLFNDPEVDAIVYNGGNGTRWKAPPVERVIAGHPAMAEALAGIGELGALNIVGVANQQGASRLRGVVY